jgi:integrase
MKMKLTDAACREKPRAATFKLFDGGGLYLKVNPSGTRQWKLAYRFDGKPNVMSFGSFPDVRLGEARDARAAAKALLAKGINPSRQRKDDKAAIAATRTFGSVFEEWFKKFQTESEKIKPRTLRRNSGMMKHILVHPIAKRGVGSIEPSELLAVLQIQEDRGFPENATRLRAMCETVFRYAMARGYCKHNPAAALVGAFVSPKIKPMAAITDPVDAGALLREIATYEGDGPLTRAAMQFLALTFVRPGEQRQAEWSEFNFDTLIWLIPASKMKKGIAHDVPLSRQAIEILEAMRPITGEGRYVFSMGSAPMSDHTVNKALRSLGYDTQVDHCAHGFRAMASSLLNGEYTEDDMPRWNPEVIEMCLAHKT